jgi:hypothetical protein
VEDVLCPKKKGPVLRTSTAVTLQVRSRGCWMVLFSLQSILSCILCSHDSYHVFLVLFYPLFMDGEIDLELRVQIHSGRAET